MPSASSETRGELSHPLSQHLFFAYILTFFGCLFFYVGFSAFSPENSLLYDLMRLSSFRRAPGLFFFHGSQAAARPCLRNVAPKNVDGRCQANHQPADDVIVVR